MGGVSSNKGFSFFWAVQTEVGLQRGVLECSPAFDLVVSSLAFLPFKGFERAFNLLLTCF